MKAHSMHASYEVLYILCICPIFAAEAYRMVERSALLLIPSFLQISSQLGRGATAEGPSLVRQRLCHLAQNCLGDSVLEWYMSLQKHCKLPGERSQRASDPSALEMSLKRMRRMICCRPRSWLLSSSSLGQRPSGKSSCHRAACALQGRQT